MSCLEQWIHHTTECNNIMKTPLKVFPTKDACQELLACPYPLPPPELRHTRPSGAALPCTRPPARNAEKKWLSNASDATPMPLETSERKTKFSNPSHRSLSLVDNHRSKFDEIFVIFSGNIRERMLEMYALKRKKTHTLFSDWYFMWTRAIYIYKLLRK